MVDNIVYVKSRSVRKVEIMFIGHKENCICINSKNNYQNTEIKLKKKIFPSAENFWKRKVVQEPVCHVCKNGLETVFHSLVGCKAAKKIWKITQFEDDLKGSVEQDLLSLLLGLNLWRSKADIELLVTIFWGMWNARNNCLFKGKKESPQLLVAKAEAMIEAYKRTQLSALASIGNQQTVIHKA